MSKEHKKLSQDSFVRTDHSSQPAVTMGAAQEALARAAWDEARACFEALLESEETPEALEGLGMAAWWLENDAVAGLAMDYIFRGEHAVANGWIRRARSLLEGIEQCAESGWLSGTSGRPVPCR